MNPIEKNANKILRISIENNLESLDGNKIQDLTDLETQDINDAVNYLEDLGAVEILRAMSTSPYEFAEIRISSRGRYLYHEIENQKQKMETYKKKLRVFVSYSHKDRRAAGAIKKAFNHFCTEAFLAHEDIEAGQEWRDMILRNLKQSDTFVAVLSKNFTESEWTDQEVGFAISNKTPIVAVSIDGKMPYGFLEMFQALKNFKCKEYDNQHNPGEKILDCNESVFEIIEIMTKKLDLSELLKNSLIESLKNMGTYKDSEKLLELLNSLQPYTPKQINEIVDRSIENNQIHNAHGCQSILKELLENYGLDIEPENKKKLIELIKTSMLPKIEEKKPKIPTKKEEWINTLLSDVNEFNRARAERADVLIDLRGANLREANLSGADLRRANLIQADLWGATLIKADLEEADLRGAHLEEADLREANLIKANLSVANLSGADLSVANLSIANLWRANLWKATLIKANLRGATLIGANLRGAKLNDIFGWRSIRNFEYTTLIDTKGLSKNNLAYAEKHGAIISRLKSPDR